MMQAMKVDKLSVSFAPDLGDAVRDAARHNGSSLSAWLADAATAKLRAQALADYLSDWEAEHGKLTTEEIAKASADLRLPSLPAAA
jgi:hypothetical protein